VKLTTQLRPVQRLKMVWLYLPSPHIRNKLFNKARRIFNYIKPPEEVTHYHTCTESLHFLFWQTVTAITLCKVHHSPRRVFMLCATLYSKTVIQSLHTILIHTPKSILGPGRMKSLSISMKFC
jgi:hypothetical protein